jgi:hypothetical protein
LEPQASCHVIVVDLERLAIKRDRKFLVRLVILLALGVGASVLVLGTLTGENVSGCAARAFLGDSHPKPDPE